MVIIRQATIEDMVKMQRCNLRNLPENYTFRYYLYHALAWPQILFVAEAENENIVGYVMTKLDEEEKKNSHKIEAHITSLSVLRTHRKLGIATKLMRAAHDQMIKVLKCHSCSLRVRVTNRAAISLYTNVLGYQIQSVEDKYYADGEDAYDMSIEFN